MELFQRTVPAFSLCSLVAGGWAKRVSVVTTPEEAGAVGGDSPSEDQSSPMEVEGAQESVEDSNDGSVPQSEEGIAFTVPQCVCVCACCVCVCLAYSLAVTVRSCHTMFGGELWRV